MRTSSNIQHGAPPPPRPHTQRSIFPLRNGERDDNPAPTPRVRRAARRESFFPPSFPPHGSVHPLNSRWEPRAQLPPCIRRRRQSSPSGSRSSSATNRERTSFRHLGSPPPPSTRFWSTKPTSPRTLSLRLHPSPPQQQTPAQHQYPHPSSPPPSPAPRPSTYPTTSSNCPTSSSSMPRRIFQRRILSAAFSATCEK